MHLGLFITAGSISIIGAFAEKILEYKGKEDTANKVSIITKGALGTIVVTCVVKLIKETATLLSL